MCVSFSVTQSFRALFRTLWREFKRWKTYLCWLSAFPQREDSRDRSSLPRHESLTDLSKDQTYRIGSIASPCRRTLLETREGDERSVGRSVLRRAVRVASLALRRSAYGGCVCRALRTLCRRDSLSEFEKREWPFVVVSRERERRRETCARAHASEERAARGIPNLRQAST